MLRAVVGHSNDPDSESAICEILQQCDRALAGETPKAGILLCAVDFEHELLLQHIHNAFPDIELIGCTGVGEMSSVLEFQEDSAILMLFCSDEIDIQASVARNLSLDTQGATHQAVASVMAQITQPPKLCLVFAESLGVNGANVVKGLVQALGTEVPVFGGLAGDDWCFKQTYQFFGTEVLTDAAPILIFSGNLLVSCGVATGQHPIGKQGIVTKSNNGTVYEIDGQPAFNFYRDYFGDIDTVGRGGAIGGSIAVFEADKSNFYLRAPSCDDPETKVVHFFGDVPEQAIIQLTKTTETEILGAAAQSLTQARQNYLGKEPSAALIVSCSSRLKNLATRACEEHQAVKQHLGKEIPNIGFYAFGEIAPFRSGTVSYLHNETFLTLLIGTK